MCARTFWRMNFFLLENFLPHGYLNSQLSVIEFLFTLEVNLSTHYFSHLKINKFVLLSCDEVWQVYIIICKLVVTYVALYLDTC
jgi:hypothetical protein